MFGLTAHRVGDESGRARLGRGVFAIALGIFQTSDEQARPLDVRRSLTATLCGRASNVAMAGFAFALCGLASLIRDGFGPLAIVAAVGLAVIVARCGFILRVQKRTRDAPLDDPDTALVTFSALAVASSICWGLMCFIAMIAKDQVLAFVVLMSCIGTSGSVAARNVGAPRLAKAMLVCNVAPIMLASLFPADHGFRLLILLAPAMGLGLFILIDELNQRLVESFEMQIALSLLSNTDPLTTLSNRRHFDIRIDAAVADAASTRRPIALLMIDVDHFKAFNDRHGHLAGDARLREIAGILRASLRGGSDVVFRYGGEEFAVLLEDATADAAILVGERIRLAVLTGCGATISAGVASSDTLPLESLALIRGADEALYRAKNEGRNRVLRHGTRPAESASDRAA